MVENKEIDTTNICSKCGLKRVGKFYSYYYGEDKSDVLGTHFVCIGSDSLFICNECLSKTENRDNKILLIIFLPLTIIGLIGIISRVIFKVNNYYWLVIFLGLPITIFVIEQLRNPNAIVDFMTSETEAKDLAATKKLHLLPSPRKTLYWTPTEYRVYFNNKK